MTTKEAAAQYETAHVQANKDKRIAVYNPHNKPISELPVIYGYNGGGNAGYMAAILITEDGFDIGDHTCSSEAYMPHDLGILENSRPDRHVYFRRYYPDGYRMEFVSYNDVDTHKGLQKAFENADWDVDVYNNKVAEIFGDDDASGVYGIYHDIY